MGTHWTRGAVLLCVVWGVSACNFDLSAKKPDGPPTYAVLRLRHSDTRVEMLTIMQAFGQEMCKVALSEFTRAVHATEADMQGWKETERDCREELSPLHQRLFNDEQVHATYMKITVKEDWQYESRVVFYGIPSSQAHEVCQQIGLQFQGQLNASTECIRGTEG